MKKVTPYKSYKYALASLDNGGRFYNLMAKANDGEITSSELAKAAGVFSDKQKMILYLELSLILLPEPQKEQVLAQLSDDLKAQYLSHKPSRFTPTQAKCEAKISSNAIITGVPKLIDFKTEFKAFIMIPITTNNVTTITMVPIIDEYDVYKLEDHENGEDFFIAHNRSHRKLPEKLIRCAGVVRELESESKDKSESNAFLEIVYYSLIP